jgi:hypothetical protein
MFYSFIFKLVFIFFKVRLEVNAAATTMLSPTSTADRF